MTAGPARPRLAVLLVLTVATTLGGCDATREGREAWNAGRKEDAYEAFTRAVRDAGDDASPELLYDRARAAHATGRLVEADRAAREAASRGGDAFVGLGAFLRGNVAFLRSEAAEAELRRPGGDPRAYEAALLFAEDALAAWQTAATSRADWPAARRNVERGLLRLDALRERRKEGRPGREVRPGPSPEDGPLPESPAEPDVPPTPPDRGSDPEEAPEAPASEVATAELPPKRVRSVLDVLRAKEREKRATRRAERRGRSRDVEKDW